MNNSQYAFVVMSGDTICVTKGFVTEVCTEIYLRSSTKLLTIQIDGTINGGNSGGPVITGNKVLGVALQSCKSGKRIGTHGDVIPTPIIRHFIASSAEESSQNAIFGSLILSYQSLENDHIRDHFKMSPEMTGVLINKINSSSGAYKILRKNDIILAIDGVPIGLDGKGKERISFNHLISMKKPYEKILVKVLRKGKEHEYNISLKPVKPHISVQQYYNIPSYYIFGGFVFVPLTKLYIDDLSYMCGCVLHDQYEFTDEQHVIISQVMSHDINQGYSDLEDLQVKKVNGVKVKNLKHLCELIEGCCRKNLRLDLEDDKVIVLNYKSAKKATFEILERHNIKSAWAIE
ncbi:putative protease Do-like 12, mitochondrial [Capsella rubella]|uniref:putative protease Do-like 12, mitochondrial n=1 Tax=Capsella rubella TaxID=81985 RepID=UPI000CD5A81B|nr:putative protease Do-like 12, mitochondrial [Capsella rubella]